MKKIFKKISGKIYEYFFIIENIFAKSKIQNEDLKIWGGGGNKPKQDKKIILKIKRSKRPPLIISGNGPSLAQIDYERLPENYEVFRCNQFYFKDKYFLGKKIKAVFFNPSPFISQYFTLKNMQKSGEYEAEKIIISELGIFKHNEFERFKAYFPDATSYYLYLKKLKSFHAFVKYHAIFEDLRATTGVAMSAAAAAMGYKKLYIAGIDFYQNEEKIARYAFASKTKNLLTFYPDFKDENAPAPHSYDFDLRCLKFLENFYGIEIFSLCPSSIFAQHFPLAPLRKNSFMLEEKPANYTKDLMLPSHKVPKIKRRG